MAACHFLDETTQRVQHVGDGLTWTRLRKEGHEIDRIPFMQGNTDFRIAFEAADTRALTGTRVDNDDRWFRRVETIFDTVVAYTSDTEQRIVSRPFEPASIENKLVVEVKERRLAGTLVGQQIVGTLAQRVDEEDPALPEVALIIQDIS